MEQDGTAETNWTSVYPAVSFACRGAESNIPSCISCEAYITAQFRAGWKGLSEEQRMLYATDASGKPTHRDFVPAVPFSPEELIAMEQMLEAAGEAEELWDEDEVSSDEE